MIRGVDLADLVPHAIDAAGAASDRRRTRGAGKRGGLARAARQQARLRALPWFPFRLANAVVREPRRRGATPVQHVEALAARHHAALLRTLTSWKIHHASARSPLVHVPFLLAGYYLARMLAHVARPPHHRTPAFVNAALDGHHAIWERWGSGAVAQRLFRRPQDQGAWLENCGAAAGWIDRVLYLPPDVLGLVRQCANPACRIFYRNRGSERHGPRASRTCSGACRVALLRARRGSVPRRTVTTKPVKRKGLGVGPRPRRLGSPQISRLSAR